MNSDNPAQPSEAALPQTPASKKPRKKAQKDPEKLETILATIDECGWSLAKFLQMLFKATEVKPAGEESAKEKGQPAKKKPAKVKLAPLQGKHQRMLAALFDGTSKPHFSEILELAYQNAVSTSFKINDTSIPPGHNMFNVNLHPNEIMHGNPGITSWSVRLVARLVSDEAELMTDKKTGLHLRASAQTGGKNEEFRVSWDKINTFSMKDIEELLADNAPIMAFIANSYTSAGHALVEPGVVTAVKRTYRPRNLVSSKV